MSETDNPLAALAAGDGPRPWAEPATLRTVAAHRRIRRRVAVGAFAAVAAVTGVAVLGGAPAARHRPPVASVAQPQPGLRIGERQGAAYELVADAQPHAATDPVSASAVAAAEQEFTVDLLRQLNKIDATRNTVVSPSSLALALAMLQTGATGQTAAEISRTLHTGSLSALEQDAGWRTLLADLTAAAVKDAFTLESADSVWLQQGLRMVPGFMTAMRQYFDSGVWQVDFARDPDAAVAAFNAWVADKTHGKITQLLTREQVDQTTVAILANATYFKAAWASPFSANLTQDAPFHLQSGQQVSTPFMSSETEFPASSTPGYDAVQLAYQSRPSTPPGQIRQGPPDPGGRFAALVVMPKQAPLTDFVATLDASAVGKIVKSLTSPTDVVLPRFDLSDTNHLEIPLQALGMRAAFGPAELSGMFPDARPGDFYVSHVVQKATLKVDENGSEASAATGIVIAASSLPRQITFNRPFLFLIRDTTTGTILFAAEIRSPATN